MKNCLIYGNCQIEPLREILETHSNFASNYQFIQLQPVHLLQKSNLEDLKSKIAKTDLFIHQLVSDDYQGIEQLGTNYLCSRLPSNSQKIAIPGAYFTGYHPAIINLKDGDGNKINEPCDYHDVNLLYLFDRGKTVSEAVALIQQDDFYQPEYVLKNLEITLNELRRREQDLDICISDFISQNYRKQKLFHTINHPDITILNYLAECILNLLELPVNNQPKHLNEVLDFTDFPIYPSVAQALKLDFDIKPQYRIKGETLSLKQTVELFFDFYAENRELVKLNIIQHQEKYAVTVCGIQVKSTQIFSTQILDRSHNSDNADDLLDCIRQQTFQDLLDLAEQHCNNDRHQEAISLCQAALKIDSQSIQGWRQLAHCYEAKGELKAAITASDRAISIDPEQADSTIHQARLLELQGKTLSAKKLYQQAISLDEAQPPWVYRHFGNVLMSENNPADATIAYQKAIALNPDFGAQIYLSLANAYCRQQQWQQAKNAYNKALDINPDLQEQIAQKLKNITANS
ncbi:Tetratricopeptide repeat protein [Hyella patelloides LEGE 07179]|uniref:Tetratricopeptide repeat protein n=1 Tax=Hyella patelloides LEGE 07179 TaxID=945734 RepID=A0A563VR06_9CYAN|nr:WcbI family polysaccharide biosynthesis putative acetyltransferase [Hyella patelloides]VEP13896.1 Tetratricopeptide repeat protein [Hyella patelloides LEGE 07179]